MIIYAITIFKFLQHSSIIYFDYLSIIFGNFIKRKQ